MNVVIQFPTDDPYTRTHTK